MTQPEPRSLANDLAELKDTAMPLIQLAGLPVTAVDFVANLLHTFVTLHTDIQQARKDQRLAVAAEVDAQGIFPLPYSVDTTTSSTINFYKSSVNKSLYKKAFDQLQGEVVIVTSDDSGYAGWPEALEVLKIAMGIIPEVENDGQFAADSVLGKVFNDRIHKDSINYHKLIAEIRALNPAITNMTSHKAVNEQISPYIRAALSIEQRLLDERSKAAATELNESIKELFWAAVLDDRGIAKQITDFVVDEKLAGLDKNIKALDERKLELDGKDKRAPGEEKELKKIEEELEHLRDQQEKLTSAKEGA